MPALVKCSKTGVEAWTSTSEALSCVASGQFVVLKFTADRPQNPPVKCTPTPVYERILGPNPPFGRAKW
jgi:hypothetical protein